MVHLEKRGMIHLGKERVDRCRDACHILEVCTTYQPLIITIIIYSICSICRGLARLLRDCHEDESFAGRKRGRARTRQAGLVSSRVVSSHLTSQIASARRSLSYTVTTSVSRPSTQSGWSAHRDETRRDETREESTKQDREENTKQKRRTNLRKLSSRPSERYLRGPS